MQALSTLPKPTANYQPVVEILRSVIEPLDAARRATLPAPLALLVPDLVDSEPGAEPASDIEGAKFRLFEAVASTVAESSVLPPLCSTHVSVVGAPDAFLNAALAFTM